MAPLRDAKIVTQDICQDLITGKYYKIDQNVGTTSVCGMKGDPVEKFHLGTTGVATKQERRERGLGDFRNIGPEADLFDTRLPEKWMGYGMFPHPEIEMDVNAEFGYKVREYLQPKPPKIGTVSLKVKKPAPPRLKWKESRPSFLNCLDTQFAPTIKISKLLETVTNDLGTWDDVNTLQAKNKQLLLDSQPDPLDALRGQRSSTKGKFGSVFPPFDPLEISTRETLRDAQINPNKYKQILIEYEKDKQGVDQRRKDRYAQHYIKMAEEKAMLEAQAQAAA